MRLSLRQLIQSLVALVVALVLLLFISQQAYFLGEQPLWLRALPVVMATLAALIAVYPLNPLFRNHPIAYLLAVCLPALLPAVIYYLVILPEQAGQGFAANQHSSATITDSSSNGYVEVGFSYPIYTPTIAVTNQELFSRQVNVFLRVIDGNGDESLFRAVRDQIPGSGLNVEASVRGLLSENDGYLFLPLALAPLRTETGRLVFIISNLDDGSTFTEALGRAYQAQFELRDPQTGVLLHSFPLTAI